MSKIFGWKGKIDLSFNGGVNFYDLEEVTSCEVSIEAETDDVTTFQDNGFKNEEAQSVGGKISIEGWYAPSNFAQAALQKKLVGKQDVLIRHYVDKNDLTKYFAARCSVTSMPIKQEAAGRASYSLELTTKGVIDRKGY